MLPIRAVIHRIRRAVHDDEQRINFSDGEILDVINAGLRIVRRSIADIQPEILMKTTTGILKPGEDEIHLKFRPMTIVEVTAGDKVLSKVEGYANKKIFHNHAKICGNKTPIYSRYEIKNFAEHKLDETNLQHIRERFLVGHPKCFYRVGMQTLKLHPRPRAETAYTVRTIDDIDELRFDDETPLLNEFDDFLIEYAIWRLSLDEEFDMTQEQQIIASISQQIAQILSPPPPGGTVRGYW